MNRTTLYLSILLFPVVLFSFTNNQDEIFLKEVSFYFEKSKEINKPNSFLGEGEYLLFDSANDIPPDIS